MFDPAAFDNMKTVIEGALYDFDLNGEIVISDRNDCLNIAKMSRRFTISFKLSDHTENQITANLELEAGLKNLAAELLPGLLSSELAGCRLRLKFCLEVIDEEKTYQEIADIFGKIWGEKRKISQSVEYNPLDYSGKIRNAVTVDFDRIVGEDQMCDLVEMIHFMTTTLQQLKAFESRE